MVIPRLFRSSSRRSSHDRDRSNSCTHLTMSRLWDETGHDKCSLCYTRPILGWLYRCTQDYNGFLPASDFHLIDNIKRLERDADLYILSPSVSEAATKGHYTDAELDTLWKQKIHVRNTIRQTRPTTSSSMSSASSSNYSIAASATYSTLPSTESETDPEPESEFLNYRECLQPCRSPLEPIQEVSIDLEKDHSIVPFVKPTLPLLCNFKVCHNCRPNYRERAWLSLNAVLKTQYRQLVPPRYEVQNKKIAETNVVKKLGVSTSSLAPDRDVQHLFRAPVKRNSRTEFQGTVQRLLKNQDSGIMRYISNFAGESRGRQELSSQMSYQKFAGTVSASSMNEVDTSFALSTGDSASFGNRDTTFSSIYDILATPDNSDYASSLLGPRPLYHRRGFERMASIKIPPRSASSHYGESISSLSQSTHRSTSSCPGMMERSSIEQDGKKNLDDEKENKKGFFQLRPLPEIVVSDSDSLLPF